MRRQLAGKPVPASAAIRTGAVGWPLCPALASWGTRRKRAHGKRRAMAGFRFEGWAGIRASSASVMAKQCLAEAKSVVRRGSAAVCARESEEYLGEWERKLKRARTARFAKVYFGVSASEVRL